VLVAIITYVPALAGAVYKPAEVIVPPEADHVTPVSLLPETVAVNCCVPAIEIVEVPGLTETDTPVASELTETLAVALAPVSTTLVATTV